MRSYRFAALTGALLLILAFAACSGGGGNNDLSAELDSNAQPKSAGAQKAPEQEFSGSSDLMDDPDHLLWLEEIQNPGEPGVDYDPNSISLQYFKGASVPDLPAAGGFGNVKPAEGFVRAEDRSNPNLRKDKSYEPLTNAIALRYGLLINHQVYTDMQRFASFKIPEGVNGQQVIDSIRSEFKDSVEYVYFSQLYRKAFLPNDPDFLASSKTSGVQWGLRRIECVDAWDFSRGEAATRIAVCDTGVRITHEELAAQTLDPAVAFPDNNLDVQQDDNDVSDPDGHGTGIAGLMVAQGNNARTIVGVAHQCELIPIKIANASGSTSDGNIIAGCTLAMDLGARSVNLSWGRIGGGGPSPLRNMVNDLASNGVYLACSAGNDNVSLNHYPSDFQNAISVGSTNPSDGKSSFSNFSDNVDIAAPGQDLRSTGWESNTHYRFVGGTSFSSPIVAAAAGLLWSAAPDLTLQEVRDLLESNGAPTTGFSSTNPVLRLDIAAAFEAIGAVRVTAPQPGRLIHGGVVDFSPVIGGDADRVEARLNGSLVQTLTSEPWDFSIDTSSIVFGTAIVEFTAFQEAEFASASVHIVVDNSFGTFPLVDDFEKPGRSLTAVDVKSYSGDFLDEIKAIPGPGQQWTEDALQSAGPAIWTLKTGDAFSGTRCMRIGEDYGDHEIDVLVTKRINLTGGDPSLVYYQRYNIENGGQEWDKGWVYVTTDDGQTFTPATIRGGGPAFFSGYQAGYQKVEIDLAEYFGDTVHIAFVLESDIDLNGEEDTQPSGWWVDKVTVASNFNESVPTIDGVNLDPFQVVGNVPVISQLDLSVINPQQVTSVRYILDVAPLGTIGFGDVIQVANDGAPFAKVIELPGVPNQLANMRVQYFDAESNPGPEFTIPMYIFNQPGDVNADNIVDQSDLDGFAAKVGLSSGDAGYVPFYDSDLDGTITEADASAIGYFWGDSI